MRQILISLGRRLATDERGAVLLMFTLYMVPLLAVIAVAVDFSHILVVKQKLTNAVDAAAIAVGRHPDLTDEEATAMGQAFIRAHYPDADLETLAAFHVDPKPDTVDVTATARVTTTFLRVLSYDTVDVTVASRVQRQQRRAEVVMVLDNSGSMAGTKIANLKTAANKLVDILFGADAESEYVKVGLVPFTAAVNIGTDKIGSGWLDTAALSPLQAEDIDLPPLGTLIGLLGNLTNVGWGGCVKARAGASGYDLTDEPPDAAVGETLFVPYVAPDEPTTTATQRVRYNNSYLADIITTNVVAMQRNIVKYLGLADLSGGRGPNYNCVQSPIHELTNNKAAITSAINSMAAGGNTVIPEGLAWGWRVLSPTPPYTEGAPYSDQSVVKVLILLTDGENNVGGGGNGHNKSSFSAYGYAASGHLGATDGSQTRQTLDGKTRTLCSNIKGNKDTIDGDQDIFVYTISFQVPDLATRTMLQDCATPARDCPGNQCYYESPTATALEGAFSSIALGINELRVAR